jgi:hypothetical protein
MWHDIWELLKLHHQCVGITGDSITFIGGLMLSAEALFKKKDRRTIAIKGTVSRLFPGAEDKGGVTVSATETEERQVNFWEGVAKAGVVALTIGFFLLLVSRISE